MKRICQLTQSKELWDGQCRGGGAFAAGDATDFSILVDKQNILCRTLAGHFQWCGCGGDWVCELLWRQWPCLGTSQNPPCLYTWRVSNECCGNKMLLSFSLYLDSFTLKSDLTQQSSFYTLVLCTLSTQYNAWRLINHYICPLFHETAVHQILMYFPLNQNLKQHSVMCQNYICATDLINSRHVQLEKAGTEQSSFKLGN